MTPGQKSDRSYRKNPKTFLHNQERLFRQPMPVYELSGKVSLLFFHIYKLCIIWKPYQIHRTDRAISLFCDDDLRNILILRIFIVIVITVNKHNHIRILLNGSGFS